MYGNNYQYGHSSGGYGGYGYGYNMGMGMGMGIGVQNTSMIQGGVYIFVGQASNF